ncbi:MAG: Mur ligase family protein [Candidatus Pacebacteria bacterium]|nr:Mur ligase family protein [Candidatus Paceibacterota bacterium]
MAPKAKTFKFIGYQIYSERAEIIFKYSIEFYNCEPINFSEIIILPKISKNLKKKEIHKFLEPLSLILGISYYKLYCPPKISTLFELSKEEAEFWNTVYQKGLGEFLYRNKLDSQKLAKFPYKNKKTKTVRIETNNSILLGIGGGKDSIVAMELLKNFKTSLFLVEAGRPDLISNRIIEESNKSSFIIKRILDPKIFKEYEGSYNGHIPVSAVFAFLGILSAFLYEYEYVVVGNEFSSNFGNIKYKGEVINHQWSKSAEFESLFQEYVRTFITPDIVYFSLLRQFHEIRIAKMFAQHKKYFPLFSSCNRNFRIFKSRPISLWCGECPKCLFVFLMFTPFVEKKKLIKIFGKNLLADEKLLSLYRDILGFGKMKPFDCVGTFDESQVALHLASKKGFGEDIVVKNLLPLVKDVEKIIPKVFKTYSAPTLPTQFKLLGLKNVCILGYGKEGKVTEKYLKKNYPELKIGILDQSIDKNYLEKQSEYDFAIKTPGIPKDKVKITYTTATNIFFSKNKNFTIGITGSKGKSTTTSLIYEIFKKSGKKVRLLGNIGNPMLGALLDSPKPDEIFVIELSSYMLEDIEYSPNVAVLLNLFPEHMNYHRGVENYYQAKNNIFKFQKPGDIALCPPFTSKIIFKKSEISLLGKHNLENIKVSVKVAKLFNISDSVIKKTVANFKGLSHRLEYVGEFKGIKFYDDAISTTPESTIAAIQALPNTTTIFLGGEDRGYHFNELEKVLRKSYIKNIVLFPDTGKRILRSKKGFKILETRSMEEAVKFAFKNTPKGKVCLLSTASPSYSLWKNFEEKGDLFKNLVKKYGKI